MANLCQVDNPESVSQLFLKLSELPRELGSAAKRLAHFRKGPHDKDVDSRSPDRSPVSQTDNAVHPTASPHVVFTSTARALRSTLESMGDALLGEGVGKITTATATAL